MIYTTLDKCDVCSFFKKSNPRSRVCLPRSLLVNEILAIDLKDFRSKFDFYILYKIDVFSRLMMARIVPDKRPESIIKGLNEWAFGRGTGLGWPRAIFSDNGAEFVNSKVSELTSKLNMIHKTTPSYCPSANGLNERRHWTCDILFEKAKADNFGNTSDQQLLDSIVLFLNSEVNEDLGFSPLQIVSGRNPAILNTAEFPLPSTGFDSGSDYVRSLLASQNKIREYVRSNDISKRVSQFAGQRVSAVQDKIFQEGQRVIFQDPVDSVWKRARLINKLGRSCSVDFNGQVRKVDLSRLDYDRKDEWDKLIAEVIDELDNGAGSGAMKFPRLQDSVPSFQQTQQQQVIQTRHTHTQTHTHTDGPDTRMNADNTHTFEDKPSSSPGAKNVQGKSNLEAFKLAGSFVPVGQGERKQGRPKNHSFVMVKHADYDHYIYGQVISVAKHNSRNPDNFTMKFCDRRWSCSVGENIECWEYIEKSDFEILKRL